MVIINRRVKHSTIYWLNFFPSGKCIESNFAQKLLRQARHQEIMTTSLHEKAFHITGSFVTRIYQSLGYNITSHRYISLSQRASNGEVWCFIWYQAEKVVEKRSRCRWFVTPWCPCDITAMIVTTLLPQQKLTSWRMHLYILSWVFFLKRQDMIFCVNAGR